MAASKTELTTIWQQTIRPFLGRIRRDFQQWRHEIHDSLHRKIFGCSLWNEEMKVLIRSNYQKTSAPPTKASRLIVCMSEGTEFAGLADRLRTMVSAYIIAAENHRTLHIYHDKGFLLQKYLLPNEVDWNIAPEDICRGLNHVSFLWFCRKLPRLRHSNREYHAYALFHNLIPTLSTEQQEKYGFTKVFNTLFHPTPHLTQLVEKAMQSTGLHENDFVAVHIRSLSFFEPVEEHDKQATGSPEDQKAVLTAIHAAIDHLYRKAQSKHILLCSDSNRLLQEPYPGYVKILPGVSGHIIKNNGNDETTDKAFTDLFVMSKAKCLYRITGKHLYNGGYIETAAGIGGKELINLSYERFLTQKV